MENKRFDEWLAGLDLGCAARLNPRTHGIAAMKTVRFPVEKGPMSPDFGLAADMTVIILLSWGLVFAAARLFEKKL